MHITDEQIAAFAWQEFCKYGLSKTTMADVANSAGISRQSLYNRFKNKDELVRLIARLYFKKNLSLCNNELKTKNNLKDVLDTLVQYFIIEAWMTVRSLPIGDELEQSNHSIISKEWADATDKKITLIKNTFFNYLNKNTRKKEIAYDLAKYFCASANGIKSLANDELELNSLCKTLKLTLESIILDKNQILD